MEGLDPLPPVATEAEVIELSVTEKEDFQPAGETAPQDDAKFIDGHEEITDKEKLRKTRQKLKKSEKKRKKRLLAKNLKIFSAAELQQSVANLTSGIATNPNGEQSLALPLLDVDNSNPGENGHWEEAALQSSNPMACWPNAGDPPASAEEIAVYIMDLDNPGSRLSMQDLAHINESLEKLMYKDLTITPKLKISNSYMSWSKHVCVICLTQFTANWVIQAVRKMKTPSGRKFSACLAKEIMCWNTVTMLVPKECGFVDSFAGLARFLTIHNPSLSLGTIREMPGRSKANVRHDPPTSESSTSKQEPEANESNMTPQSPPSKVSEEVHEKTTSGAAAEQISVGVDLGDLDAPRRARSFTFYADDTWVQELKQLPHGPFLGLRILPFFLGEKTVLRVAENGGRNYEQMPPNSKNLRGGGGRNRKKKQNSGL